MKKIITKSHWLGDAGATTVTGAGSATSGTFKFANDYTVPAYTFDPAYPNPGHPAYTFKKGTIVSGPLLKTGGGGYEIAVYFPIGKNRVTYAYVNTKYLIPSKDNGHPRSSLQDLLARRPQ